MDDVRVRVRAVRVTQVTGPRDVIAGVPHATNTEVWGITGADLGIPIEHDRRLYLLFGDAMLGEDPLDFADPIGFTYDPAIDAGSLRLGFVTGDAASSDEWGRFQTLAPAVAALKRDDHQEDVVVVGREGGVYTNWVVDHGPWNRWIRLTDPGYPDGFTVPPGSAVAAVKRDGHQEDVFAVGRDGGVYTNWVVDHGPWNRWIRLTDPGYRDGFTAPPGSAVAAVKRDDHQLDVFVVGRDGGVYTNWVVDHGPWNRWIRLVSAFQRLAVQHLPPLRMNETPTGGFSYGDRLYVFVVAGNEQPRSYLASGTDPARALDLHGLISSSADPGRRGFYLATGQVVENARWAGLPDRTGDGLLIWGWADGQVHLAYRRLDGALLPIVGSATAIDLLYRRGDGSWSPLQAEAAPVAQAAAVSHVSVGWLADLGQWMLLYTLAGPGHPTGQIVCRFSPSPWSWSEEQVLFDPMESGSFPAWMHQDGRNDGIDRIPPVDRGSGWVYCPQLLPRYTTWDGQRRVATIYFSMSTNDPYQVMLMRAELDGSSG